MAMAIAGYLSVTQAAPELHMTRQGVWHQIKVGAIRAMKVGEVYVIPKKEVRRVRRLRISQMEKHISALREMERAGN